jgi:DNA modification methylase
MRRYIRDESVDLVYLDPPFNSNATYNVLFTEKSGAQAAAQIKAFEDTWKWDQEAARAFQEVVEGGGAVSQAMQAFRTFLGTNDMLAYLAMMAPRLMELRRVLKPTGSIYLHCDPTASHYLKMLMDAVFGVDHYLNEISWRRSNPKSHIKVNFSNCRDIILRYSKTTHLIFNMIYAEHDPEYVETAYRYEDAGGRYRLLPLLNPNDDRPNLTYEFLGVTRVWRWTRERMEKAYEEGLVVQLKPGAVPQYKKYLSDSKGRTVTDNWDDIGQAAGNESLGYPTQKPEALLERIIKASSNEGDVVLDPFCGCGTAIAVAQRLNRRWIGIDVTHLAITLMKNRLETAFGEEIAKQYDVIGEPVSLPDAQDLAANDPYQFQWWALGLVGARPAEQKKGADKGIDGRLYFHDTASPSFYAKATKDKGLRSAACPAVSDTKQIVISVKAGHTNVAQVRDLRGVLDREKEASNAVIGVLICMEETTQPMRTEAATAGFYTSPWGQHPRLQILTVGELLEGKRIDYPPHRQVNVTFKKAPRAARKSAKEEGLGI